MSGALPMEEIRISVDDRLGSGRWEFPRGAVPPHPLAVLLPDTADRDLDGARPSHPRLRPFLEIAWALARREVASFRCTLPEDRFIPALDMAWEHGARHVLASRQRVALVVFGDEGVAAARERIETWSTSTAPLGVVLVGFRAMPDLGAFAGIHTHAILPGAADRSPDPDALAHHAEDSGVPLGITTIDDLTEHLQAEADWIAGRAVPHPRMCTAVADAVGDLLRPRWERDARPPGTAIGTA